MHHNSEHCLPWYSVSTFSAIVKKGIFFSWKSRLVKCLPTKWNVSWSRKGLILPGWPRRLNYNIDCTLKFVCKSCLRYCDLKICISYFRGVSAGVWAVGVYECVGVDGSRWMWGTEVWGSRCGEGLVGVGVQWEMMGMDWVSGHSEWGR